LWCLVEALVIIQLVIILVVRSGYIGNVKGVTGSMYKVMKTFVCRGCMNQVTGTGCTHVDIGVNANLELVDKCARPRGGPKKTWREIVEKDCQACKLNR